ncbi:MAG: hypothetical protein Q8S54_18805 [Bacteroidota bacterium]|nr:hypothetical protein [Odoribacter sp.]MDP3645221.1 hypothetical protein [Bacteroidota bacterium]
MIKLGIFGDETTSPELLEQLKTMRGTEVTGVYYSGNAPVPDGFVELTSPIGLMDISDAILIQSDKTISCELIRLILRKSKHMYLKTIPNLNIKEIKDLIDLEKEAGIVTFIYNPFNYIPYFDPFTNKFEKPLLINLRTCFESASIKPSHELLLLITALNRVVQSNFKKLEIFGMKESGSPIILNLRIEYENGSVINLTITQEKIPGNCEIFEPTKRTKFEFQTPLYILYPYLNQEYAAIGNFIRLIQDQDKKGGSFDNLLNGVQIVHEIRTHLRFKEIDF